MLALGKGNFRAPGEHHFSTFQLENIPWCKCVLLTSPLLNILSKRTKLLRILCTLPITSAAECEGSFSTLRRLRATMTSERESGLALMNIHYGRRAEEENFKANFSFFTSLSAAKAHVFGVKFIGLCRTVVFIAIRDFSFRGESDLWSDVWPAMDGVVCLSILLEGRVTVSNNFTKGRQNGSKIGPRDKFAIHLR